ncbi:MAG: histidine kinase dimerization/phospho-acceptor domain-containing protein [Bacteroidota bacterium]
MLSRINKFLNPVKDFILRYPAILASYFIYGYYFISTMDFYIKFKNKHFGATDALKHFDTLLWMWVLAYALVKVIELREKLHQKEKEMLEKQHDIELKETQIQTLHEVIMTLKHEINNPLAIILGYVRLLRKQVQDPEATKKIDEIENASQRINHALKEFSAAQVYEVTASPVGNLVAVPPRKEPQPKQ